MNCAKWEKLIALYVEDDLAGRKVRHIEDHLHTCLSCQDFYLTLKESQKHLQSLMNESLDEANFQDVRTRVMDKIAYGSKEYNRIDIAEIRKNWDWAPFVAGALLILLIVLATLHRNTRDDSNLEVRSKTVKGTLAPVLPNQDFPRLGPVQIDEQVVQRTIPIEGKKPGVSKQSSVNLHFRSRSQLHRTAESQSSTERKTVDAAIPSPEPLYIELTTGDPDVVIVWLVDPIRGEK